MKLLRASKTKKTMEQILNDIFSTDVDQNEHEIENFRKEYGL